MLEIYNERVQDLLIEVTRRPQVLGAEEEHEQEDTEEDLLLAGVPRRACEG